MAVRLRLRRLGRKKLPIFKIVAADSRSPRDGKFLEAVGQYYPLVEPMGIELKEDRVLYWLQKGAQPSDTVKNLLSRKGLWLRWSLMKKGTDEATINAEFEKWQSLQAEKLRHEAERKARRAEAKRKQRKEKTAEPAPPPSAEAAAKTKEAKQ